jgi:enoyl-CoA hydratase
MTSPVTFSRSGPIGTIVMDDGKVNAMSYGMLDALHTAFDQAEKEKTVVILVSHGKHFSAGFDLKVLAGGSAGDIHKMLKAGAELALRILSFPAPVVSGCNGNAFPMGAFLILASDYRIAAEGDYKIGLNEVAIGIQPPQFGIELARQRLVPAYFSRTVTLGEMFAPGEALTAGFFDQVVPADAFERALGEAAAAVGKIDRASHAATKLRARAPAIEAIRATIKADITLKNAQERVAIRDARG